MPIERIDLARAGAEHGESARVRVDRAGGNPGLGREPELDRSRWRQRPEIGALAAELLATNGDFRRLWAENEIHGHWIGRKHFDRPDVGPFELETSAYAVDGADGLSMIIFTPVGPDDVRAVQRLMAVGAA